MQPGPARGETATRTIMVTPEMTARVGSQEIHPILGTHALVSEMETLCRGMLEPHLERGEEGVGYEILATHHAPAPLGAELKLTAAVADVNSKRLLCEVTVRHGTRLVATGRFEQRLVAAEEFQAQIREAASRV